MVSCYSGWFLPQYNPVVPQIEDCVMMSSSTPTQESSGLQSHSEYYHCVDDNTDYVFPHTEFLYNFLSAFTGKTPLGDPTFADSDGNGYISIEEAFQWEKLNDKSTDQSGNPVEPQHWDPLGLSSEYYL